MAGKCAFIMTVALSFITLTLLATKPNTPSASASTMSNPCWPHRDSFKVQFLSVQGVVDDAIILNSNYRTRIYDDLYCSDIRHYTYHDSRPYERATAAVFFPPRPAVNGLWRISWYVTHRRDGQPTWSDSYVKYTRRKPDPEDTDAIGGLFALMIEPQPGSPPRPAYIAMTGPQPAVHMDPPR